MKGMSLIVKTMTRLLLPFILLFGAYLMLHGNISHGAGFVGGAVIAMGFALLIFAHGRETTAALITAARASFVMYLGLILFLAAGVAGMIYGTGFLAILAPEGIPFELQGSGTLLLLNILLCLAAAGALVAAFFGFVSFKSYRE